MKSDRRTKRLEKQIKESASKKLLLCILPVFAVPGLQAEEAKNLEYQSSLLASIQSAETIPAIARLESSQTTRRIKTTGRLTGKLPTPISSEDARDVYPHDYISHIAPTVFLQLNKVSQQRIERWLEFLAINKNKSESAKLEAVNDYFNKFEYIEDNIAWKKADLWATPLEVLVRHGGDCEDFAIAKFFTLRALNLAGEKLRLTFVKNLISQQSHMVLDYYSSDAVELPLVLDNMQAKIQQRNDLRPVYSFNEKTVWEGLKKDRGLGSSSQIERWKSLQDRLRQQHIL